MLKFLYRSIGIVAALSTTVGMVFVMASTFAVVVSGLWVNASMSLWDWANRGGTN